MILPFWWITLLPAMSDEQQEQYNEFLCILLYLPLSLMITAVFVTIDIIAVPLAYFVHLYKLIKTLNSNANNMDETSKKL